MNKYILLSLFSLYIPAAQAETCEGLLGSENYAKAAEIGRTDKNFAGLMCLGKVLSAQNKHNDALQSFTDAENTAANGFEQVMAVIFQARANRDAGQTQQAYSQYQRGFELAVTHKIRQGQLVVLNEPGQMLLDAHDSKIGTNSKEESVGTATPPVIYRRTSLQLAEENCYNDKNTQLTFRSSCVFLSKGIPASRQ